MRSSTRLGAQMGHILYQPNHLYPTSPLDKDFSFLASKGEMVGVGMVGISMWRECSTHGAGPTL